MLISLFTFCWGKECHQRVSIAAVVNVNPNLGVLLLADGAEGSHGELRPGAVAAEEVSARRHHLFFHSGFPDIAEAVETHRAALVGSHKARVVGRRVGDGGTVRSISMSEVLPE